ncbi:hypothetical protein XENOCAPTIV_004639, partial [Xenoophorus captivus]
KEWSCCTRPIRSSKIYSSCRVILWKNFNWRGFLGPRSADAVGAVLTSDQITIRNIQDMLPHLLACRHCSQNGAYTDCLHSSEGQFVPFINSYPHFVP